MSAFTINFDGSFTTKITRDAKVSMLKFFSKHRYGFTL
jgi:hypothetical protein